MDFNINSYPGLKDAIQRDNLVLFIGAGCSLKLKNKLGNELGNWENLVKNILQYLKDKGNDISHLENALKTESALKVLELLEKFNSHLDINLIFEFTDKFLELDENNKINDFSFHQLLTKLSTRVITTNYDKAFEIASPEIFKNCIIKGDKSKIERIKKDDNFLLKLHGCYTRESSMVLFKSDYENLYENQSIIDSLHLLTCLSNLFYNKTILFIGYGMGDQEINIILKNIQKVTNQYSHKHFIISKDKLDEELKKFLIHIPISEYVELSIIINKLINVKDEFQKERQKNISDLGEIKSKYKELMYELFEEGLKFQDNSEYENANKKYSQISILEKFDSVFTNWGLSIYELAKLKNNESLYQQSIEKYKIAIDLNPKNDSAFNNWGNSIKELAKLKNDESLYQQSFEKYQIASDLNPNNTYAFNNWGIAIKDLAKLKNDESLYMQSFKKYHIATDLNPKNDLAFNNWSIAIYELAKLKNDEFLYLQSFDKFLVATDLNPNNSSTFYNWGIAIHELAKLKNDESLYLKIFEKYQKATDLNPNDDSAFYNWGNAIKELAKLKNDECLYLQSFEKYKIASDLNPKVYSSFNNWGLAIFQLAQLRAGTEKEKLLLESERILIKGIELGSGVYNRSCLYSIWNKKEKALENLEIALQNKEIPVSHIEEDEDWENYWEDPDFKALLNKYRT